MLSMYHRLLFSYQLDNIPDTFSSEDASHSQGASTLDLVWLVALQCFHLGNRHHGASSRNKTRPNQPSPISSERLAVLRGINPDWRILEWSWENGNRQHSQLAPCPIVDWREFAARGAQMCRNTRQKRGLRSRRQAVNHSYI